MGLELIYEYGQTPLDDEEKEGLLIPTITTQGELDEFEQLNIQKAVEWSLKRKWSAEKIFTEEFIKQLHQQMYGDVWLWAGKFRKTNKNLGVDHYLVGTELKILLEDVSYWIKYNTYPAHEITIRFKHRIVSIHCFPNGNGRHSRLIADIISDHIFKNDVYSWGDSELVKGDDLRKRYITALKKADQGEIEDLIEFAQS
jgi:Fic-DOC domain mobile mystery protein B